MKYIVISLVIAVLFLIGVTVVLFFSYNNQYNRLKNKYDAQLAVDRAVYDEVWKTIQQQAGVSEKYSEDFRKSYQSIMSARNYGGEMMKWITESNPTFSPDLYSKLMNTIESQRTKFTNNQKMLISVHKEIKDLVTLIPGSWFLMNKEVPELKIVTSTRTEETFSTGTDDNIELFQKDSINK